MNNTFFIHVNNHVNRKSYKKMTSREKKRSLPSYTVVGKLEEGVFKFGVSVCSKEDSFSKEEGRKRAIQNIDTETIVEIPQYVVEKGQIGKYFVTKAKRLIK